MLAAWYRLRSGQRRTAAAVLAAADDCSITFWDTAGVYGAGLSETRIGRHCADSPGDRIIATKVGRDGALYPNGYTKANVRSCLEGSLRRLGAEVLDLVQLTACPPTCCGQAICCHGSTSSAMPG